MPTGLGNGTLLAKIKRGEVTAGITGTSPAKPKGPLVGSNSAPTLTLDSRQSQTGEGRNRIRSRGNEALECVEKATDRSNLSPADARGSTDTSGTASASEPQIRLVLSRSGLGIRTADKHGAVLRAGTHYDSTGDGGRHMANGVLDGTVSREEGPITGSALCSGSSLAKRSA